MSLSKDWYYLYELLALFLDDMVNNWFMSTILDKTERRIYLKAMVSAQQSYLESKNKKFSELRSTPANGGQARQPS